MPPASTGIKATDDGYFYIDPAVFHVDFAADVPGAKAEFMAISAQAQIKAALAKKPNATVYSYPGQRHAFSRHNGTRYNATAAVQANGRTSEFLNQHLRDPRSARCERLLLARSDAPNSRSNGCYWS